MNDRAKHHIDNALKKLTEALSRGHSEPLKEYLRFQARFHRYSWFNVLMIAAQNPKATYVAGFKRWQQMGRFVSRGEKGIMILAPVVPKARTDNSGQDEPEDESKRRALGFVPAWVFDVGQTEGDALPLLTRVKGDPSYHHNTLLQFAEEEGIEISYLPSLGGAIGRSRGGKIEILEGLDKADEFSVLVHELAHELLHQGQEKGKKPLIVRETEAEAVAFVVCEAIQLDTGTSSQDYIHLYRGDAKLLMASLSAIQKASAKILNAMLPYRL